METLADGRYAVIRRLAAGGMGEVLLAHHTMNDALSNGLVVLKRVLAPEVGRPPDPQLVRMFREEARLSLRLAHENLIQSFRLDEGPVVVGPLLALEFLAGQPMSRVMDHVRQEGRLIPLEVCLRILRDACCGLHFAHTLRDKTGRSLGLVHRDVSPTNVFVTYDGRVKVIDFGVAKAADTELRTATGHVKGKNAYMSPEQAMGERRLTAATDVWALGVFAWESLVLRRLFRGRNAGETLLQITEQPIHMPSSLRSDVPNDVDALVARMLSRDIQERFSTCAEVVHAIDALALAPAVQAADIGSFLMKHLADAAAAGLAESARAARWTRDEPRGFGLVDGPVCDVSEEESRVITTILDAKTVSIQLAQALSSSSGAPEDSGPSPITDVTARVNRRSFDAPQAVGAHIVARTPTSSPVRVPVSRDSTGRRGKTKLWALVGSAAGVTAVLAGLVAASAVEVRPAPSHIAGYRDARGAVVLVAEPAHIPRDALSRFSVDVTAPVLPGRDGVPTAEDPSLLRSRLEAAGVWGRAALPSGRERLQAVLPLVSACAGALAIAFSLPALVAGTAALVGRVILVGAVSAWSYAALRTGALGWPGTRAWQEMPAVTWVNSESNAHIDHATAPAQ